MKETNYEINYKVVSKLIPKGKVLDIGAGSGKLKTYIKNDYTGVDLEPLHKSIKKMNAEDLKFKDNSFDVIVMMDLIEHVSNPDKVFQECHRILKKNGTLIISTPNVYHLQEKIRFLISNTMTQFNYRKKKEIGHTHPFYDWNMPKFFKIKNKSYNRGWIYWIRMPFFKSSLFGQTSIYTLIKK